MTHLAWVTQLQLSLTAYLVGASVVALLFGLFGTWALWRVRRMLAVLPTLENRLATLSNSVSLLTDTTEACFKALGAQLQIVEARPVAARPPRKNLPRRPQAAQQAVLTARARLGAIVGQRADGIRETAELNDTELALR